MCLQNWLFTAALSERGPQTAKETAVGLLCRIFLHHNHGASVSLNKLGRFYHLLVQGLAEATLTEAIFHTCTEIFWSDLPGTTVLIWPFIQAATTVFKQPAADDDRVMLMQWVPRRPNLSSLAGVLSGVGLGLVSLSHSPTSPAIL